MKTYNIYGIDDDLYKEFKAACAFYDISIRELFIKYMKCIVLDYRVQRPVEQDDKPQQ